MHILHFWLLFTDRSYPPGQVQLVLCPPRPHLGTTSVQCLAYSQDVLRRTTHPTLDGKVALFTAVDAICPCRHPHGQI